MARGISAFMVIGLIVASVFAGVGAGFIASQNGGFGGIGGTVSQTGANGQNSSSPYVLSMVITTGNTFNSMIGDQPAYYVLGPNGLVSSADITLPANSLIELVITNFDNGGANISAPEYANVMGTTTGSELVYNNTAINSTEGPNGMTLTGSQSVTSLPTSEITHTFTVPGLNLNLPMASDSTIVAYFKTGAAGSFVWLCESACGSGADGSQGAMITTGWMTGAITVG